MSNLYREAGVDINKGEAFVNRIKTILSRYPVDSSRVYSGVGGFASLFSVGDRFLAAGSDGVGTKIKVAQALGDYATIGQDLVAMCLNDVACTGAKPLFFMDYLACDQLQRERDVQIVEGVAHACQISNCVLIGGETAEMPGCYPEGGIDLAGFGVGEVYESEIINANSLSVGDSVLALSSNGLHSNGFSFFRKWVKEGETELLKKALRPTFLYSSLVRSLVEGDSNNETPLLKGVAHITGGGIQNLARILPKDSNLSFEIDNVICPDEVCELFSLLQQRSKASLVEMYKILNMGMGLIIVTSNPEVLKKKVESFKGAFSIDGGRVETKEIGRLVKRAENGVSICLSTRDGVLKFY